MAAAFLLDSNILFALMSEESALTTRTLGSGCVLFQRNRFSPSLQLHWRRQTSVAALYRATPVRRGPT